MLREIARGYGDAVLFVDLAAEINDRNEWFKDVGHMSADGIQWKARRVGDAIAAHARKM